MNLKDFTEKYVKREKFKLHSGQYSDILYDVDSMLTNYNEWIKIFTIRLYIRDRYVKRLS